MRKLIGIFLIFFFFTNNTIAKDNIMILKLKDGDVKIELFPDVAPNHVERIKTLATEGKYDNVVFHRVIDGFMAQTGDVMYGNSSYYRNALLQYTYHPTHGDILTPLSLYIHALS